MFIIPFMNVEFYTYFKFASKFEFNKINWQSENILSYITNWHRNLLNIVQVSQNANSQREFQLTRVTYTFKVNKVLNKLLKYKIMMFIMNTLSYCKLVLFIIIVFYLCLPSNKRRNPNFKLCCKIMKLVGTKISNYNSTNLYYFHSFYEEHPMTRCVL